MSPFDLELEFKPPSWLKVGVLVDYHWMIGGPVTQARMEIRELAQLLDGQWVVWLRGKAGCVAVEAVTLSAPEEDER